MRHNRDVKTYEIDLNGQSSPANNDNEEVSVEQKAGLSDEEIEEKERIIKQYNEDASREHQRVVGTNPFMFRVDEARKCNIHSIEDFTVKVKRKVECPMKEVLRTDTYKLSKRKKVILGSIKSWIKDFKENKSKVVLRVSDVKESVKPSDIKKISVGAYIFLPLGLALLLVIYFNLTPVWGIEKDFTLFGKNLHLSFMAAKNAAFASAWVNIVAVVGIYIAIASILFIGLYHSIFHEFNGYTKTYRHLSDDMTNKINNDFNKKSKKTLNYYKKALRKKECKMDPLPIEQTGVGEADFTDLEALSNVYMHKMSKMSGRKSFLYIVKFILFKGTYLCASGVLGYVLFELVRGLF